MDPEAKIIIAFLFNRSGKTALKESEIYLPLSMELGWFSTKEAHEFVTNAIRQELLVKKEGMLYPTFSLEKIMIPMGFTPSKKKFVEKKEPAKKENIIEDIVSLICEKTGRDNKDALSEIAQVQKEKNILPEVAALLVARRYALSLDEWYDAVEKKLLRGSTK